VRGVAQIFSCLYVILRTLPAVIILDRFDSDMTEDGFSEVQRQLEAAALELRSANDPERRRTLLREMSRLLSEAQRISLQPPKMSKKPGES
jgi:hypothetical protein